MAAMTLSGRGCPDVAIRQGPPPVFLLFLAVGGILLVLPDQAWAQGAVMAVRPLACNPGFTYHFKFDLCLRCRQGTYKNTSGSEPCVYCPKDSNGRNGTTHGDGAINLHDCYFRPYMRKFFPQFGPVAGGTAVTITMGYLKNHTLVRARFSSIVTTNCTRRGSSFVCVTPPSTRLTTGPISVEMMDERSEYVAHSIRNFSYLPNPNVTSIDNLNTFLSGGIQLTVRGQYLTSVASPEMVVTRVFKKHNTRRFSTECTHPNSRGTLMVCPTPDLNEPHYKTTNDLKDDEQNKGQDGDQNDGLRRKRQANGGEDSSEQTPLNNEDLEYFVSFKMDGVANLDKISEISVFKDPVYDKFAENHFLKFFHGSRDKDLYIAGKRLDHIVTINDIDVIVGDGICLVTSLVSNLLICIPPVYAPKYGAPGPGPDNSHYVQVLVGSLRFHVGYLKYVDEKRASMEVILGMTLLSICLFWLLVLFAVVIWLQRRSHNRRKLLQTPVAESKVPLPGSSQSSASSRGSSGAGEYLYTGNGSSNNSEDTATTGVPSLEVDVETPHMMPIDIWSALEEPLKSKVKDCQIDSQRLTLGDCIGVGSFGRVFKGEMDTEDGGTKISVAVKTLRGKYWCVTSTSDEELTGTPIGQLPPLRLLGIPSAALCMQSDTNSNIITKYGFTSASELPQFLEEGLIMAGFQHKHILPLYGVAVSECLPFVVSEYMDRGDLRSYIKSDESISVDVCLDIARQVAEGMVYLSGEGFIHRDLAARNCLINSCGVVKIGDFGLSRDLHGSDYYRVGDMGRPLPVKWMSIESLNLGKFSTKSDVWSFGVVLWELLTRGRTPYNTVQNIDLKDYLNDDNRLSKPLEASDPVYEIMRRCWRLDPGDRPTFEQLVMYLGDVRTIDHIPTINDVTDDIMNTDDVKVTENVTNNDDVKNSNDVKNTADVTKTDNITNINDITNTNDVKDISADITQVDEVENPKHQPDVRDCETANDDAVIIMEGAM